jgi:hypothetical protein
MKSQKWLMSLNLAGDWHIVLFDGESVYEELFPEEKIQKITTRCGISLDQSQLVDICSKKMETMNVVQSAFDGRFMAEDKSTPFTSSVASETYWSS